MLSGLIVLVWMQLQVEDPKRALILFGGKTSQITKDVLSDLHKLKAAVSQSSCLL